MTEPLLEVHGLQKHFRLRGPWPWSPPRWLRAVDGVDLEIARGETLALVGESGSGKTTLARCLLRLVEPTAGEVRIGGECWTALSPAKLRQQRKRAQIVFQDPQASLPPRRSVEQILREPLDWHGIGTRADRPRRVRQLLARVGLGPSALPRYPHAFSGGQRQRIGIARALAVEPELIVADEAVSALDGSTRAQILNLLADLQRDLGLACLFIAHDLSVVQHISHRVAVMVQGQLVEVAPTRELFANPAHPHTQALIDAVPGTGPRRGPASRPGTPEAGATAPSLDACRYHPHCPHARPVCRSMAPREIRIGDIRPDHPREAHRVRCHLHDPEVDTG